MRDLNIVTAFSKLSDGDAHSRSTFDVDYWRRRYNTLMNSDYTSERIKLIIKEGTRGEKLKLSEAFFLRGGIYSRILLHYATLLKYTGVIIPSSPNGSKLSAPFVQKLYKKAVQYWDRVRLETFFINCSLAALVYGNYCGIVKETQNNFIVMDLPISHCRVELKDAIGNDIVEFDVSYFNSFSEEERRQLLNGYPSVIKDGYARYLKNPFFRWVKIPTSISVSFSFVGNIPPLLAIIEGISQYDDSTDLELENLQEDIRKIVVQQIPHLKSNGELLFEPPEAASIHKGTSDMMANNPNISVLTTYADTKIENSQTTTDASRNNNLNAMAQNIYLKGGVASQLFATTNAQSMKYSIANDLSFMMILAHQFSSFISKVTNNLFSNKNIEFKYSILPVSYYNDTEYISNAFKLAQSGYSLLVPALAMGMTQGDLLNLKELENDVLNLEEALVPLKSAYTQSGKEDDSGEEKEDGRGRPKKPDEEKSESTVSSEKVVNEGGSSE